MRHLLLWVLLIGRSGSAVANKCGSGAIHQNILGVENCACQPGLVCEGTNCMPVVWGVHTWVFSSLNPFALSCDDCECVAENNGGGSATARTTTSTTTSTRSKTTTTSTTTTTTTTATASSATITMTTLPAANEGGQETSAVPSTDSTASADPSLSGNPEPVPPDQTGSKTGGDGSAPGTGPDSNAPADDQPSDADDGADAGTSSSIENPANDNDDDEGGSGKKDGLSAGIIVIIILLVVVAIVAIMVYMKRADKSAAQQLPANAPAPPVVQNPAFNPAVQPAAVKATPTAKGNPNQPQPWFVGPMPSKECDALVRYGWKGQFLVRNSIRHPGAFSITTNKGHQTVHTDLAAADSTTGQLHVTFSSATFQNINHLILHWQTNGFAKATIAKLGQPIDLRTTTLTGASAFLSNHSSGNGLKGGDSTEIYGTPFSSSTAPTHTHHFFERIVAVNAESTLPRQRSPLADLHKVATLSLHAAAECAAVHCCPRGEFDFAQPVQDAEAAGAKLIGEAAALQRSLPVGMEAHEIAAIHLYTQHTPLYGGLNGALGGWGIDGTAAVKHYLPYAKLLMAAFEKLPRFACKLFRGVRLPVDIVLDGKKKGDVIETQAVTSTTMTADVLQDDTFLGMGDLGERTVLQYAALSAVSIKEFSDFGNANPSANNNGNDDDDYDAAINEDEVILVPGSRFVIDDIIQWEYGVTEVRLHQLPPELPGRRDSSASSHEARAQSDPLGVYAETHRIYEDIDDYMVPGERVFQSSALSFDYDRASGSVYSSGQEKQQGMQLQSVPTIYAMPVEDGEMALPGGKAVHYEAVGANSVGNGYVNKSAIAKAAAAAAASSTDGGGGGNTMQPFVHYASPVGIGYVNKSAIAKAAAAAAAVSDGGNSMHPSGAGNSNGSADSSATSAIVRGDAARASGQYGFEGGGGGVPRTGKKHAGSVYTGFTLEEEEEV